MSYRWDFTSFPMLMDTFPFLWLAYYFCWWFFLLAFLPPCTFSLHFLKYLSVIWVVIFSQLVFVFSECYFFCYMVAVHVIKFINLFLWNEEEPSILQVYERNLSPAFPILWFLMFKSLLCLEFIFVQVNPECFFFLFCPQSSTLLFQIH